MPTAFETVMEDRKKLAQQIIDNIEHGYVIPPALWNGTCMRPHNPVSKAEYKGGNALRLYISQMLMRSDDCRWVTFNQAADNNWKIKSGSKSVICEKWIFTKKETIFDEEAGRNVQVEVKLDRPKVSYFRVFNGASVEGMPPPEEIVPLTHDETMQIADEMIAASKCPVLTSSDGRAYYSPVADEIHLPPSGTFIDSKAYLSVLFHEMIHSTGHESRLNRNLLDGFGFGSESYAREELRAELGSFFLEKDLGIAIGNAHLDSHTAYLDSWLSVLKKDYNELFRACADADKAAQFLSSGREMYMKNKVGLETTAECTEVTEAYETQQFTLPKKKGRRGK